MGFRINGITYYVKSVLVDLNSLLIGETNFDNCEIIIRDSLLLEKQKQTFWHEIVHILFEGEESGLPEDEKFVTRFSNLLNAVLEDNHLLKDDWWTRVLDEHPNLSAHIVGAPRVAARGRRNHQDNAKRKR